jgi:hypothetical protein
LLFYIKGAFGVLWNLLILQIFIFDSSARKAPSDIIIAICIFGLLESFHYLMAGGYMASQNKTFREDTPLCYVLIHISLPG